MFPPRARGSTLVPLDEAAPALERPAPRGDRPGSRVSEIANKHGSYWVFRRAGVSRSEQKRPAWSSFRWQYGWQYTRDLTC